MKGTDIRKLMRQNIRDYAMYIALVFIMGIFAVMTQGVFISSRNISNLLNQTGYIAVLAVGMTLVIVIRHFDMSVGFLSGFLGAIAAIAMVGWGFPSWLAILLVLVLGIIAGLITAFPIARLGIPAFVATLAGWLIYRGALLLVTLRTGTIIIPDKFFDAIGNGYIPDILPTDALIPGMHKLTLLLGLIAAVWFIARAVIDRRNKKAYDFEVLSMDLFVVKMVFMTVVIGAITWVLAGYNGLSWTVVILIVIVLVYDFIMNQTALGRRIYAVGGNPEAAELSGISVKKITFLVFGSMGLLTGVCGVLFASRLQSATTTGGTLFELDAIASAYIGGVSAAGGVGKVTGAIIGALVYMTLMNGMNLLGTDISLQYIIRGAVLAAAVIFDVTTSKAKRY